MMHATRKVAATLVLGFALFTASCTDASSPTAPQIAEPSPSLLGDALDLLQLSQPVQVLHRTVPLAHDESASAIIGPEGGVLRLPEAGLSVRVPQWAVASPTRITVVAPAGNLVGYTFSPHGLKFRHDLVAIQDLQNTDASGLLSGSLQAAYYEGELQPTVNALELLDVNLLSLLGLAEFDIAHFSGYVIATN